MQSIELHSGQIQEITMSAEKRRDLFVAVNNHIVAKDTVSLDIMRQDDTMRNMLALLQTRADIDALAGTQPKVTK